jgi:hypothetical protein
VSGVALGFSLDPLTVPLDRILPSRKMPDTERTSAKVKQIQSSIAEIGLVEPLSVTKAIGESGQHMLLDGHVRLAVLQALGYAEAPCLIANDDEGFTYNNRVNRLSTIQEHLMIRRAVERGVSPERLAKVLCADVRSIAKKAALLNGICPEAAELLKDRHFSTDIARVLRRMKPTRQVECVELMISANNLSASYAEAMLVATPVELLVDGKKPSKLAGVSPEQIARMEREMSNVQAQYRLVEESYGQDVMDLVLAQGYIAKLLDNTEVTRYLKRRQPEILGEFERLVQTASLES